MKKLLLILILLPSLCLAQFNVTYYYKCDKLSFTNGTEDTDTTYNVILDPDSVTAHSIDYYYVIDYPDSAFWIEPEDCDTPQVGEIIVDIDSLIATPDGITLKQMYYSDEYALDYYYHKDSARFVEPEDLDTNWFYTHHTDTNSFTLLQMADTCTAETYDCYTDDCTLLGWEALINDSTCRGVNIILSQISSPTYFYIQADNAEGGFVWSYFLVSPKTVAVKVNNKFFKNGYSLYKTYRHNIYISNKECSYEMERQ